MRVEVRVAITDWDGDEVVLVERTERVYSQPGSEDDPELNPYEAAAKRMFEIVDEAQPELAKQAAKLVTPTKTPDAD